jgi:hypothetical protein
MVLHVLIYDAGAEATAPAPAHAHEPAHMVERAARALVSALEAAVLLTASAQSRVDPSTRAMTDMMDAIAALIMDMTMVAMIVARTTMTTSAVTLKVMGPRSRQGDAGGGIIREAVKRLDMRSRVRVYYYFAPLIFHGSVFACDMFVHSGRMHGYDFTIFMTTTICEWIFLRSFGG